MKRVIDASVAVKWYVPEVYEQEATRLQISGDELHAPELVLPEFSNIIWKKIRLGQLAVVEGDKIIKAFVGIGIRLHSHKQIAHSAFIGAYLSDQTVYDWTYLSLALALSCEFVTADQRFYRSLEKTSMAKHLIWIGDL